MSEPEEDEYWFLLGPDDPDMWRLSCDDEMLSYEGEVGPDGEDRLDWSYR